MFQNRHRASDVLWGSAGPKRCSTSMLVLVEPQEWVGIRLMHADEAHHPGTGSLRISHRIENIFVNSPRFHPRPAYLDSSA